MRARFRTVSDTRVSPDVAAAQTRAGDVDGKTRDDVAGAHHVARVHADPQREIE